MPNCFTLTRKSNVADGPVSLSIIDGEIAELMELPVHPKHYICNWFNTLGFTVATRNCTTITEAHEYIAKWWGLEPSYLAQLKQIAEYLDANYTHNAFVQIGR